MTINLLQPAIPEQKVSTVWQRSSRFIVCLFCEMKARQVGDSPLCSNCLIDPVQTRTAIYLQMHNIEKHEERAASAWLSFAADRADAWDTLRRAESDPDYAERCKRARTAGNIYGQLLDRHAAMEAAMQPLRMERERLERAMRVLEGLI